VKVASGEMEVLLEVGRFQCGQRWEDYCDRCTYLCHECELGREGMPSEFGGIAAVNVFKELGEEVGTMMP